MIVPKLPPKSNKKVYCQKDGIYYFARFRGESSDYAKFFAKM
ncbi:hypothetical protein Q757_05450 [Oenococcus alcoholitolerans]|uniref:Integrase n=1 Tax=Oenococcus alcoholitolerans TaxID=931074 RepID=A0ABR4XQQ9_9LACO|nr:hypothetical protein Q757_05450 [Oenococcus alcoholitolerans]